jgi:TctA family transporter
MKTIRLQIFIFSVLAGNILHAHPGHGTSNGINMLHYLTSPLHVILLIMVMAGAIYVRYRQSLRQKD